MSRPSETEQELRSAAAAGEVLNLSRRGDNTVPAKLIRELVLDPGTRALQLNGARITGRLDLMHVRANAPIQLDGCVFEQRPELFHCELPALSLDDSTLPGLGAEGLRTRYFTMRDARCTAQVDLEDARVETQLLLSGTSIRTTENTALYAEGLQVGSTLSLDGLLVESPSKVTAVRLERCQVDGDLDLIGATVVCGKGVALRIGHASITGSLHCGSAYLRGAKGGVDLRYSTIRGYLSMAGAVVRGNEGPALSLHGTACAGGVFLDAGFNAGSACRDEGAVGLIDANLGGLTVKNCTIRNRSGVAMQANRMKVTASVHIRSGSEFIANSGHSAVDLTDTDIGSQLEVTGAKFVNEGVGLSIDFASAAVTRSVSLSAGEVMTDKSFKLSLDGLTYPDQPIGWGDWLVLLRERVPWYEPQPYQQLAAVHRAAGHERQARKILIAQQNDLRRRGDLGGWWARRWHWLLGFTLAYGYKPSRAVAGLLITFLLSVALVWTAGEQNGLSPAKDRPADSCSPVNRISLAADLAIPLVKLGGTPRCEFANGAAGQWATGAGWAVQFLGWSFATLSVAGFTGLVRRS